MVSIRRVARRHIIRANALPLDVEGMKRRYLGFVANLEAKVRAAPSTDPASDEYLRHNARLKYDWIDLHAAGVAAAYWVVETRAIPQGRAKALEVAARLFTGTKRPPADVIAWWEKNQRHALLIADAFGWAEKAAGGKEKFEVGPFQIHNTTHLEGTKLADTVAVIEGVVRLLKAHPKLSRVLYGDVFLVGQLRRARTLAWYFEDEDVVYLRAQKPGLDEKINLLHELGHRYWSKFLKGDAPRQWRTRHYLLKNTDAPRVSLPKVGEPLGFPVKGDPNPVVKAYKATMRGMVVELESGGGFKTDTVYDALSGQALAKKFPTPYAMTNAEEYFAEAFAHYVVGDLATDHVAAFEEATG